MTLSQAAEGHLKCKGKKGDLGGRPYPEWGPGGKPLMEVWLPMPPEADDIFVKIRCFSVLRMTYGNDICIHRLYKVFIMKWKKNQLAGRKVV